VEFLKVGDLSIAVEVSRGTGAPIVLCHGNSCSSGSFERQLTGDLARRHRVIAIDWPGHGDSGRATVPANAYTLPGYARVLVEVARQLDASDAVFVGASLGGHVVLEAALELPDALGFFVFGTPPLESASSLPRALSSDPALQAAFREESTDPEVRACLASFFRSGFELPESFVRDFYRTDMRARSAIAASVARNELRDEVRVVAKLGSRVAIVHGRYDTVVNRAYLDALPMPDVWGEGLQVLPDAGHTPQWETPEQFGELVEAFARSRASSGRAHRSD